MVYGRYIQQLVLWSWPGHTDRLKLCFVFLSPDPPTAPRWLEVVSISRNSAELKWAVPERNGGSAITNYIVEKRDVRRKGWQTVDTTVKELKCDVKPLNEGSLYVFRVAAENAVGVGPFCEMEDSVLAKDTFSKLERMRSRTNRFNLKAMKILTADLSMTMMFPHFQVLLAHPTLSLSVLWPKDMWTCSGRHRKTMVEDPSSGYILPFYHILSCTLYVTLHNLSPVQLKKFCKTDFLTFPMQDRHLVDHHVNGTCSKSSRFISSTLHV